MRELEQLLPELKPPPGGLLRLQHSLRARHAPFRTRNWRWLSVATGTCALATLALAWLPAFVSRQHQTDTLTETLLQAVAPSPLADGIRVKDGAALPLPSNQPGVRIYLIQTASPPNRR